MIAYTAAGEALPDACAKAGVSLSTVKGWLARGRRDESGPYRVFVDAIDVARIARQPGAEDPPDAEPPIFAILDALGESRRGNT